MDETREALEELVREHGPVQIQHTPYEPDTPWTVTLMLPRKLAPGVAHPAEHVWWWDHQHGYSIREAATMLLKNLEARA